MTDLDGMRSGLIWLEKDFSIYKNYVYNKARASHDSRPSNDGSEEIRNWGEAGRRRPKLQGGIKRFGRKDIIFSGPSNWHTEGMCRVCSRILSFAGENTCVVCVAQYRALREKA